MMVNRATPEGVQADMQPPNYRAAVKRIRAMEAKKNKIQSLNGEISDEWGKVEGHKVHKTAGKWFQKLDKMEPKERNDVLRSLDGLIEASGWAGDDQDMVDKAEGTVVHGKFGRVPQPGTDGEDEDDNEDEDGGERDSDPEGFTEMTPEELAAQKDRQDAAAAKQSQPSKARGRKPAADKNAAAEPYTGDNSDLAVDEAAE